MHRKTSLLTAFILLTLIMLTIRIKSTTAVTWSTNERRITTYTGYDGFPSITQTQDAKLWLVWAQSIQGNLTLYYKTSIDLGTTWSSGSNLTQFPAQGNEQNPCIIQATNGTIWVFWASDEAPPPPPPSPDFTISASPTSLSIPQGGSDTSTINVTSIRDFNEPVTLSIVEPILGVTTSFNPPSVTPPPNNSAYSTLTVTVGTTATPGIYDLEVRGRSSQKSHSVSISLEIRPLGALGVQSESVRHGENTHVRVLSSSSSSSTADCEIYYKVSHDNGATWSNDIQLTDNYIDDLRPSFIQLRNGTFFLAWQSYGAGNHDIFYMTTQNGFSWSSIKQLTTYTGHDKAPSATQTKDNKIWVTWTSNRTGDCEIYYKTYDGSSWSPDTRLTYNSADTDVTPSILQAIDSNIYIFWTCMPPTGGADIYYKYSSNNGATWSGSTQFTTDKNEDMWASLTQTTDTKIRVVWVSNRADQPDGNWDVFYRTSLAGDVNQDGVVDIIDLSMVGVAYGRFKGEQAYNPNADINKDNVVDIWDLSTVCLYYGET